MPFGMSNLSANIFVEAPAMAVIALKSDGAAIFTKDLGFM
jgi:hypothetical protein